MSSQNDFFRVWEAYQAHSTRFSASQSNLELKTAEIVHNLGGIDAILMHCLNSQEYCQEHISTHNLNDLEQLLLSDMNQTQNNTINQCSTNTSDVSTVAIVKDEPIKTRLNEHKSTVPNLIRIESLSPTASQIGKSYPASIRWEIPSASTTTLGKQINPIPIRAFYSNKLVYQVNGINNLYFKYLPPNVARFMYYKVANKKFMLTNFIFFLIFWLISFIINLISSNNDATSQIIGSRFWFAGWILLFFQSTILLFSVNLDLASIIFNSFDFWFKVVNGIVAIISLEQIRLYKYKKLGYYDRSIDQSVRIPVLVICESIGLLTIFLLDATLISQHVKFRRAMPCLWAMMILFLCIIDFIIVDANVDELNWNPFKSWGNDISKYTNVNFKNLYMSAQANIMLFFIKPMFGVIARKIRQSVCNKRTRGNAYDYTETVTHQNGINLVPSYNIYKKPYFDWYFESEMQYAQKDRKTISNEQMATQIVNPNQAR